MAKMRGVQIRVNFEGTGSDMEEVGRELFKIIDAKYEDPSFCGYTMIWDTVITGAGMDKRLKNLISTLQDIIDRGIAVGAGYTYTSVQTVPQFVSW